MMPELPALIDELAARLARDGWVDPSSPPGDEHLIDMLLSINFPAARIPLSSLGAVRDRACALVLIPPRTP